jgi:hypothetical protein
MRCPYCGSLDTQVKDSRPSDDHSSIRRRRVCNDCGGRFTTFERVQLRELMVVKRSGKRSPFDRDKLLRSVEIALRKLTGQGIPSSAAVVQHLTLWVTFLGAMLATSSARMDAALNPGWFGPAGRVAEVVGGTVTGATVAKVGVADRSTVNT